MSAELSEPARTEFEKMRSGQRFHSDPDIRSQLLRANRLCARLRTRGLVDDATRQLLRELLPRMDETAVVTLPFHCDLGSGITLGEHVYLNTGCVFLDMGTITIGKGTLLGPGCLLCTPHHPLDAATRRQPVQYAFPIAIGEQCWLGARVIVCPGVTIGDRVVIAAGSVVTRDIPSDCLVAGNPARIIRWLSPDSATRGERAAMAEEHQGKADLLTNAERMRASLAYHPIDPVLSARQNEAKKLSADARALSPLDPRSRELLQALIADIPDTAQMVSPLYCDFGSGTRLGDNAFCNFNTTILDSGAVTVGNHTLIGPNCHLLTPHPPLSAERRAERLLYAFPVRLGNDCWLGGSVTVCPGVTIGDRSIIAAGSVVTRAIPSDCLAAGNPAVVKRTLKTDAREEREAGLAGSEGMSEMEKMRNGRLYKFSDTDILASNRHARELCARLYTVVIRSPESVAILRELIPDMPESSTICPPFHCDHGHGIKMGERVFMNTDCVILDSGLVRIGNDCRFGPRCQIYTPQHPRNFVLRREPVETALPVTIGDDCWFGAGAVVCPGVTIGARCVIAAGSVVTRDIPSDSLAAGNPAVVKRTLRSGEKARYETD